MTEKRDLVQEEKGSGIKEVLGEYFELKNQYTNAVLRWSTRAGGTAILCQLDSTLRIPTTVFKKAYSLRFNVVLFEILR